MDHVFGYTIVNDVTARDVQVRHQQWDLGKSFDTFCPMGPWIVTADELDGRATRVRGWVNGELRQDGRTRDMIFDIPTLIETCSRGITLYPGDVIATGTPAGVGMGFTPPQLAAARATWCGSRSTASAPSRTGSSDDGAMTLHVYRSHRRRGRRRRRRRRLRARPRRQHQHLHAADAGAGAPPRDPRRPAGQRPLAARRRAAVDRALRRDAALGLRAAERRRARTGSAIRSAPSSASTSRWRAPKLVRSLALFGPLIAPPEAARTAIRARAAKARSEGTAGMHEIALGAAQRRDLGRHARSARRSRSPSCARA